MLLLTGASGSFCFQLCVCVSSPHCGQFLTQCFIQVAALEPFWERVREVQQARQQQSTQSPLLGREDFPSLTNDCTLSGLPLVIFAKSPSSQSGQVKTLTCRACLLSTWLFQFVCLWPLMAHQARMKRSPLQLSSQTAMIMFTGDRKFLLRFRVECCNEAERKICRKATECDPE